MAREEDGYSGAQAAQACACDYNLFVAGEDVSLEVYVVCV